jgi:DNA polymerase III sliding clamp (beta) subunit (PCNA family)
VLIPSRLKGIVVLAATESTRYAIEGVCLSRKKDRCLVQVTDGRRLFNCSWTDQEEREGDAPPDFSVIVPSHLWKTALTSKLDNVTLNETFIRSDKPMLVFDRGDCEISGEPITEGKFPNTSDIIPKYKASEGIQLGIAPTLLAEIAHVFGQIDPEKVGCPKWHIVDPAKSILITSKTDELDAVAVLMPVSLV